MVFNLIDLNRSPEEVRGFLLKQKGWAFSADIDLIRMPVVSIQEISENRYVIGNKDAAVTINEQGMCVQPADGMLPLIRFRNAIDTLGARRRGRRCGRRGRRLTGRARSRDGSSTRAGGLHGKPCGGALDADGRAGVRAELRQPDPPALLRQCPAHGADDHRPRHLSRLRLLTRVLGRAPGPAAALVLVLWRRRRHARAPYVHMYAPIARTHTHAFFTSHRERATSRSADGRVAAHRGRPREPRRKEKGSGGACRRPRCRMAASASAAADTADAAGAPTGTELREPTPGAETVPRDRSKPNKYGAAAGEGCPSEWAARPRRALTPARAPPGRPRGRRSVMVKVGMVGDSQIGKTSLMVKYVEGTFDEDYIQTLGASDARRGRRCCGPRRVAAAAAAAQV